MYLVKSLVAAKERDISGQLVEWQANQIGLVPDTFIDRLRNNTAAWEILASGSFNDIMQAVQNNIAEASAGVGESGIGLTVQPSANIVQSTVLTLDGVEIAVADADAFGSAKLFTFPEGRILVLGVIGSLQWAVTSARAGTINLNASLTWALGSVEASNATLASTMVDLIPKTTKVLAAEDDDLNTASNAALATSAQFDGTATAVEAHLNVGFETGDQIDGDGTLEATGTITLVWVNLGSFD